MKYPIYLLLIAIFMLSACTKDKSDDVTSFTDTNFAIKENNLQVAYSIQPTSDGYILGAGEEEINLIKIDRNTEIEWIRNFGLKAKGERLDVKVSHDGGYVIAGTKKKSTGNEFVANVVKTDNQGETIWMRNYGVYSNAKAHSIIKGNDGQFVFVGSDKYSGSNGSNYTVNWIDGEGASITTLDNDETVQDEAWSVVNAGNGEFVVLFSASNNRSKHKIGISKFNVNSEVLWTKMFEQFPTTNKGYKLINAHGGGFIAVGNIVNEVGGDSDLLIFKIDNQGNMIWSQVYGGNMNDLAYSILQTNDKGLVVVGKTESYGIGKNDVYLLKLSKSGKLKWSRTYGGLRNDIAYDVAEASGGDLLICGESDKSMFVLRTDKKGYPN